MRVTRIGAALAAAGMLTLGLAACGDDGGDGGGTAAYTTVVDKAKGAKKLVVGTKWDQPSLGLKTGAEPEGFDVDVAKYVVKELAGGAEVEVEWKESASSNREAFLENGTVDIIFATYSITDSRKQKVTFGGPYIVAHQDVMVRADDSAITKPQDLAGKRICQAAGSNSYKRITDPPPDGELDLDAQLVGAANYSECVQKLGGNNLDAVTTDDLILAGFAKQASAAGGGFKILGQPFTDEKYGVGLKKGDTKTCEAVNAAITKMYQDGTAQKLFEKWFAGTQGLTAPTGAPQFEPCA
ncbi:glutamate ABC transporter substrate-binding protein [Planomonospora venezuelensis]|uniref:Glutamate transport system substrate-binding protein n=1 Tax=Planomonospora venezuelensis TaxID=1999 RepID=A0A841D2W2_PLAVE|nr:glutamate ABC transporter substrate-binding protein [Planomonospora venezuelensis]MBB5964581.1 glutamate transport system substrate-binding protein [Planomonospora venezuelensis]GIN02879.1 ABC transporter substrate-binding protein [Planomonospora venezuelensis]